MNLSIHIRHFRTAKLGKLKHKSVHYLHVKRNDIKTELY